MSESKAVKQVCLILKGLREGEKRLWKTKKNKKNLMQ